MNKDQPLIEKIRHNGKEELGKVYVAYREEFIGWTVKTFRIDTDNAKEIYQLSILALYENILNNKLSELNSSLKTYIFAIGKNKIFEYQKQKTNYAPLESIKLIPEDTTGTNPEQLENQLTMLDTALEDLGDPCKSLLKLYYYENQTMDKIAQSLNYKNPDTAKNQKYKCLQRIRKIYSEKVKMSAND